MITVELNENAENRLRVSAEAKGIAVETYAKELLENFLGSPATSSDQNGTGQSAAEALGDYIGALDSSILAPDPRYRTSFGEILDEKFAKQGITLPEWER
jgi:hypothetical protein